MIRKSRSPLPTLITDAVSDQQKWRCTVVFACGDIEYRPIEVIAACARDARVLAYRILRQETAKLWPFINTIPEDPADEAETREYKKARWEFRRMQVEPYLLKVITRIYHDDDGK